MLNTNSARKPKQTEEKGKCTCRACHEQFKRLSGFDAHRHGPYADRRCLTEGEMLGRGFTKDSNDRWVVPGVKRHPRVLARLAAQGQSCPG